MHNVISECWQHRLASKWHWYIGRDNPAVKSSLE